MGSGGDRNPGGGCCSKPEMTAHPRWGGGGGMQVERSRWVLEGGFD